MLDIGAPDLRLVVVNLYPFAQTIARPDHLLQDAIEQIDIGGPTLLRSAAKNFSSITVLCDPQHYKEFITSLPHGGPDLHTRQKLAAHAFSHVASYDAHIANYMLQQLPPTSELPPALHLSLTRDLPLRYGENPHQRAALYQLDLPHSSYLNGLQTLQGKPLSYNNILDLDAAVSLTRALPQASPACTIVKHTNPAGCALGLDAHDAYSRALATDPTSAFGGIVALNRAITAPLAADLATRFFEVIAAPDIAPEAQEILQQKKNLRVIKTPEMLSSPTLLIKHTSAGTLVQTSDDQPDDEATWQVVTKAQPSPEQLDTLRFLWRVCRHTLSNAIVIGHHDKTFGVGAGQMSRVDATQIAVEKARANALPPDACLASDAFFPFPDAPLLAIQAGVSAIIQPGGSIRDQEVIDACDHHHVAMIFTHTRHFRHG
jgi:phosphoribosylaminoimidazolecarboxamide formyltransferase/IMP cyclohydrolase